MLCCRFSRPSASQSATYGAYARPAAPAGLLVSYKPLARNARSVDAAAEASNVGRPGPRRSPRQTPLAREGLAPKTNTFGRRAACARIDRHGRAIKSTANSSYTQPRRSKQRRVLSNTPREQHGCGPRQWTAPDSPYDPAALDAVSSYEEELRVSREDLLRKIEASSRDIAGRCRTAVEQSNEQEHAALFDDEERERVVEAYAAKLKASSRRDDPQNY